MGYIAAMDEGNGGGNEASGENRDELQALASRFVNLWQRQLEIMAADPALNEMMAAYSNFGIQATHSGGGDENGSADDSIGTRAKSDSAAGATAARSASRQRGGELDELARRVAACEKRLAELERGAGAAIAASVEVAVVPRVGRQYTHTLKT